MHVEKTNAEVELRFNVVPQALALDEFIIAFAPKASPRAMPSGCPKIGRRRDATGTPTRGAPNVTQADNSRTIVAGMIGNATDSELLQNERISGLKMDAPNVTEIVFFATRAP